MPKYLTEVVEEVTYRSKLILEADSLEAVVEILNEICEDSEKRKSFKRKSELEGIYFEDPVDLEKDIPLILPFNSEDLKDS